MLLFLNEDRKVGKFDVNYLGQRKKIKGNSVYINSNYLEYLPLSNSHILKKDILLGDKLYKENDTVEVDNNDITYFELLFEDESSSFNLFPKVQTDPNSDMIVFSPDVKNNILEDFYVHVRTYPDPEQETIWSERDSVTVAIKETFFLNDFVSSIEKVNTKSRNMNGNQFIAEAQIKILSKGQEYIARPAFLIDNNKVGLIPDVIDDLGVKVYLSSILPQQEKFKVSFETTQKNWVIIEAMKKPLINLMWIGFFIMIFGLTLSLVKKK
jgi:cytochrome c-type biogenesis protein CcmF